MFCKTQKTATNKSAQARFARKKLVDVRIECCVEITSIAKELPEQHQLVKSTGRLVLTNEASEEHQHVDCDQHEAHSWSIEKRLTRTVQLGH